MRWLREAHGPFGFQPENDEPFAVLRYSKISCRKYSIIHAITMTSKRSCYSFQDCAICDRRQIRHIFEQERGGHKFANEPNEMANQIGAIVACASALAGDRKRLTWGTANDEIRSLDPGPLKQFGAR